ncbi:nicotinate-nucleotide--dimethylbenzimidazole phosphoribosyltransferase [Metapseudomonas otitidis]|uniref:nicotinate-nucleotide--dimethylbenzimidazole phosphoribosyltransferase n=1 Tax=Metapseudomonas otitidis TaxID=319939 RepID=UPI0032163374
MNTDAWWLAACQPEDASARDLALTRQDQLTKPRGALGRLEDVAVTLAALQGRERPRIERPWFTVFAGDHGVVAEGVSAYPQAVTGEMLRNFVRGGAAISVLARTQGAPLELVDLGTAVPIESLPGVLHLNLGPGTANFAQGPAMSEAQCHAALAAGRDSAERARAEGADLYLGGEMGIGNTTTASALAAALTGTSAATLAGPGTGLDAAGVQRKAQVIDQALALHRAHCEAPLEALRRLGGFELAALVGAYLACAQRGIPVLVDGFICSVAALCAVRLNPTCRPWLLFAHRSAEPGHLAVLEALGAEPLLDLGLRLGEGSGAAVALPLLRLACDLHGGMATFAEAAVSDRPA